MSKGRLATAATAMLCFLGGGSSWGASQVSRAVIGSGGGNATSLNHQITATIGESVVGPANSASYTIGSGFWSGGVGTPTDVGGREPEQATTPFAFRLYQNVPNPFNPRTIIGFTLAKPGRSTLRIFDSSGRVVATLVDGELAPGRHKVEWDGTDQGGRQMASGIYFYQLRSGDSGATWRMNLIK